jgi:hypothetical protein
MVLQPPASVSFTTVRARHQPAIVCSSHQRLGQIARVAPSNDAIARWLERVELDALNLDGASGPLAGSSLGAVTKQTLIGRALSCPGWADKIGFRCRSCAKIRASIYSVSAFSVPCRRGAANARRHFSCRHRPNRLMGQRRITPSARLRAQASAQAPARGRATIVQF